MANERSFILQSFGLEHVKAAIYPPGKPLESGHTDVSAATKKEIAAANYNMSTMEGGKAPVSMLGTPVFADVILEDADKNRIQLLWALLDVNQQKNIVKTAVQGRNGTVKEYVSDGDYQVSIRGGLFAEYSNAYPKEEVATLIKIMQSNKALKVTSEYLLQFQIYELVVENYSFSQKQGVQNVQLFDIKTVSDFPIELKKK